MILISSRIIAQKTTAEVESTKTLSFGDTRKSFKHGVRSSNWANFKKRALEVFSPTTPCLILFPGPKILRADPVEQPSGQPERADAVDEQQGAGREDPADQLNHTGAGGVGRGGGRHGERGCRWRDGQSWQVEVQVHVKRFAQEGVKECRNNKGNTLDIKSSNILDTTLLFPDCVIQLKLYILDKLSSTIFCCLSVCLSGISDT